MYELTYATSAEYTNKQIGGNTRTPTVQNPSHNLRYSTWIQTQQRSKKRRP